MYKHVTELSDPALSMLKERYLIETRGNVSYGELCAADEIVPDEVVFEYYDDVMFTNDDFGVEGVGAVDWYYAVYQAKHNLGIDLNKSYFEQPQSLMYDLKQFGKSLGYKNSTIFSDARAFYRALQTKNRTLGVEGIGAVDTDAVREIYLWFVNTRELRERYGDTLRDALVRKLRKGIELDEKYLAESSVIDTIVRETIRNYAKSFGTFYISPDTRKEMKKEIADFILSEAQDDYEYKLNNA